MLNHLPGERVGRDGLPSIRRGEPRCVHRRAGEPVGVGKQLPCDLLHELGFDSLAEVVHLVAGLGSGQVTANGEILTRLSRRQPEQRPRGRGVADVREPGQQPPQGAV
ncbi:MAG: hypothetical protein DLM61_23975 [Pseudonocardiales bacterium]|nr:MAG: hypothetical protein DLM61_23975 [Pseudonocardiales bacterium]